jgi:hypothetical protein
MDRDDDPSDTSAAGDCIGSRPGQGQAAFMNRAAAVFCIADVLIARHGRRHATQPVFFNPSAKEFSS